MIIKICEERTMRRKGIIFFILFIFILAGCSNQTNLNPAIQESGDLKPITKEDAIKNVMNLPEIREKMEGGIVVEVKEAKEPTEQEPYWQITIGGQREKVNRIYMINSFTGAVMGSTVENSEEEDMEDLRTEMIETVSWVFENWQSFHYDHYDPSRYGLAFALNFRLAYLFDNYDENKKIVQEQKILSEVKITEIKDTGIAFDEETHNVHAQLRLRAKYRQEINGQKIEEPMEVLIFSSLHLDNGEGWEITNVDIYETEDSSPAHKKIFLGFTK